MAMRDAGRKAIRLGMVKRVNFKHASVRGEWFNDARNVYPRGRLSEEYLREPSGPIFVIFSYNTPIAWMYDGEWQIPNVTYSATTTNHQGLVRVYAQSTVIRVTTKN